MNHILPNDNQFYECDYEGYDIFISFPISLHFFWNLLNFQLSKSCVLPIYFMLKTVMIWFSFQLYLYIRNHSPLQ